MQAFTYGDLLDQVSDELDLDEESFIQSDEYVNYFNDGIDAAEALIHTIYEDYFLNSSTLTLVQGTEEYSLPSDIYANKIRGVVYRSGSVVYEIFPFKNLKKFLAIEELRAFGSAEEYRYYIRTASGTAGYKIVFLPAARESGSVIQIYYLRNATRIPLVSAGSLAASRAAVIDIPEFTSFVRQFVKVQIMSKEKAPGYEDEVAKLDAYKTLMTDTLSTMIPDDNNLMSQDVSFYRGHN